MSRCCGGVLGGRVKRGNGVLGAGDMDGAEIGLFV